MGKKLIAILLLFLLSGTPIFAEIIVLKSGKKVEGKIIEKTDKNIKIDVEGISITYYPEDIVTIDGKSVLFSNQQLAPAQNKADIGKQNQNNDLIDHKDIFEKRLDAFNPDFTEQQIEAAANELLRFSNEYPNSKFAIDAKYIYKALAFIGAVGLGHKENALAYLKELEDIAASHPNGSLNEFTCKKMQKSFPKFGGDICIPYKYFIPFLRAYRGVQSKDYQEAISNLSSIKDKLDYASDNTGTLAYDIYFPLVLSYYKSNELDKAKEVAKEAIAKFPNTQLEQEMQKFLDSHKSK